MASNPKSNPNDSFVLLSGIAQEIDAPLKSLLLSSQKLLDTYKKKDFEYISYKDFKHILFTLEQMNKQLNRCCQTTERISGLGRVKLHSGTSNINETLTDIIGLLAQRLAGDKIDLKFNCKDKIPMVKLSRVDGHQVMHNIVVNAIEAMPGGGKLKIRTSLDQKLKSVCVEILDEGVGINPKHMSNIFEPFFTTREQGMEKSSGLGLSVVYAIIQAAGGSITIESSLRKGTQVRILLPAVV